jgi:YgiT-type zinc finger domain-containing protein
MLVKTARRCYRRAETPICMADTRECPLCGGTMHLKQTKSVTHIPGYTDSAPKETREWVCSDCDYFEEADGENA